MFLGSRLPQIKGPAAIAVLYASNSNGEQQWQQADTSLSILVDSHTIMVSPTSVVWGDGRFNSREKHLRYLRGKKRTVL
jgi:hypothetical protein